MANLNKNHFSRNELKILQMDQKEVLFRHQLHEYQYGEQTLEELQHLLFRILLLGVLQLPQDLYILAIVRLQGNLHIHFLQEHLLFLIKEENLHPHQ
ncbi:hypothetical protein D3C72_2317790 [compost metagenome]